MSRNKKGKQRAVEEFGDAAAHSEQELQHRRQQQCFQPNNSSYGHRKHNCHPHTSHADFGNVWTDHDLFENRPRRRNSDIAIHNDHSSHRQRWPRLHLFGGSKVGWRRPYMEDRRRGNRHSEGNSSSNENSNENSNVRTRNPEYYRSHRLHRSNREVLSRRRHLKKEIETMLDELAQLQLDPEETERKRPDVPYYVSETPPRAKLWGTFCLQERLEERRDQSLFVRTVREEFEIDGDRGETM